MRLAGKVAIITGAGSGIGRGTANLFAREGATVVIAEINAETGQRTADEITAAGGEALFLHTDVHEEAACQAMVEQAVQRYGRLDVLMNNAYYNMGGTVVDLPVAEWDRSMNVMVRSIYLGCKYAVPAMIASGGGSIINIASVHGLLAAARGAVYEPAKSAVINLSREIAVDFGPQGIRCNAICPGLIITERGEDRFRDPAVMAKAAAVYPVRRAGRPIDIAYGAVYLASDESTFVTGTALVIDGGLTCWLQDSLAHHLEEFFADASTSFKP
jgi:NAD(P)-dependent dehydrogenase (short-subunit alcohol dehydrogenase family)